MFLLGRFAVVAVHETAHGLAMASFGRRVEKAGLKLVVILPYAFVDTSRGVVRAAPPADRGQRRGTGVGPRARRDLRALLPRRCRTARSATSSSSSRSPAYVGAFFNLNPFLERDGYHILVDHLREPGLRRRAREQFARRLSGRGRSSDSPVLARYSAWGLAWTVLAGAFAIALSLRYEPLMTAVAPKDGRLRGARHAVGRVLHSRARRRRRARCWTVRARWKMSRGRS